MLADRLDPVRQRRALRGVGLSHRRVVEGLRLREGDLGRVVVLADRLDPVRQRRALRGVGLSHRRVVEGHRLPEGDLGRVVVLADRLDPAGALARTARSSTAADQSASGSPAATGSTRVTSRSSKEVSHEGRQEASRLTSPSDSRAHAPSVAAAPVLRLSSRAASSARATVAAISRATSWLPRSSSFDGMRRRPRASSRCWRALAARVPVTAASPDISARAREWPPERSAGAATAAMTPSRWRASRDLSGAARFGPASLPEGLLSTTTGRDAATASQWHVAIPSGYGTAATDWTAADRSPDPTPWGLNPPRIHMPNMSLTEATLAPSQGGRDHPPAPGGVPGEGPGRERSGPR